MGFLTQVRLKPDTTHVPKLATDVLKGLAFQDVSPARSAGKQILP